MRDFEALKSFKLKTGTTFIRPVQTLPEHVMLSDSALSVMTDLNKVSLVVTRPNASMESANAKMIRYVVRMLLVLDSNDHVAGLLTANDILGEKPMRFLQNMGGTHADIMVRDLMTPQRELEVFKIDDVRSAEIGQIVASLKKSHRQHGLVVSDGPDGKQSVCGLFSITQIASQLGLDVAQLLAEVEAIG
jgi:CBS-domain-containing membrane protein